MKMYRVTMTHAALGTLERLIQAATPADAIAYLLGIALQGLRDEASGRALLEMGELVFKVEIYDRKSLPTQ